MQKLLATCTLLIFFIDNYLAVLQNGQVPAVIDQCSSDAARYWMPVLLSYKAVYLIVGLFLASQTFNVKIKKLRDSKLIVASVYETVIASVILTFSGLFLTNSPTILYLIIGLFISFFVTSVLCLLFVPRVRYNYYVTLVELIIS